MFGRQIFHSQVFIQILQFDVAGLLVSGIGSQTLKITRGLFIILAQLGMHVVPGIKEERIVRLLLQQPSIIASAFSNSVRSVPHCADVLRGLCYSGSQNSFPLSGCFLLEDHGLRRRLVEDNQPYQRWACERPARGREACPQAAAECLHARFPEISFGKCYKFLTATHECHRHAGGPHVSDCLG
jgi:hypothetical protein